MDYADEQEVRAIRWIWLADADPTHIPSGPGAQFHYVLHLDGKPEAASLHTLPWRQRNIRECRIGGPNPNLFKAPIGLYSAMEKAAWVLKEENENPSAEFWQFHFTPDETKTGIEVEAVLPRQLVGLLEEYLTVRHNLLKNRDPLTLMVNAAGQPHSRNQMTYLVSQLTLRSAGRRVPPHRFRDIASFTWLRAHRNDTLRLSKMLWHKNDNLVKELYGGRFNESSGVCAMEEWLDERGVKQAADAIGKGGAG